MIGIYGPQHAITLSLVGLRHSTGPHKISKPTWHLNHVCMALACIVDNIYTMLLAGQTETFRRQRDPVGHPLERMRERERFITSFPAISGLIRCVEDPF